MYSSPISLRISVHARQSFFPTGAPDEQIGSRLWDILQALLQRPQLPRTTLMLLYPELTQSVDLVPLLQKGRDHHRAISSFASLEGLECIALVGILQQHRRGRLIGSAAAVFVEWPDGRWWFHVGPTTHPDGTHVGPDRVFSARQGHGKPTGLGGWFRRARFESLKISLQPTSPGLVN